MIYRSVILFLCAAFTGTCYASDETLHLVLHEYPPLSFSSDGKPAGVMTEMMEAVCAEAQIRCEFSLLPWRRALVDVELGRAQGIFPFIVGVEERRGKYLEMAPMLQSSLSFVTLKSDSWVYSGVDSLRGKTVVVFGPSGTSLTVERLIKQTVDGRVEFEVNSDTVLRKLIGGRYSADVVAVCNRDVAQRAIAEDRTGSLRLAGDVTTIYYTLAFSKTGVSAAAMGAFGDALARLKLSGRMHEIAVKFGAHEAE